MEPKEVGSRGSRLVELYGFYSGNVSPLQLKPPVHYFCHRVGITRGGWRWDDFVLKIQFCNLGHNVRLMPSG